MFSLYELSNWSFSCFEWGRHESSPLENQVLEGGMTTYNSNVCYLEAIEWLLSALEETSEFQFRSVITFDFTSDP